jgi:hypothetical protein
MCNVSDKAVSTGQVEVSPVDRAIYYPRHQQASTLLQHSPHKYSMLENRRGFTSPAIAVFFCNSGNQRLNISIGISRAQKNFSKNQWFQSI